MLLGFVASLGWTVLMKRKLKGWFASRVIFIVSVDRDKRRLEKYWFDGRFASLCPK
jgi:hypothetical protein